MLARVPVAADALGDRAVDAVERLHGDHVPAALVGLDAEVVVTGVTAENTHTRCYWLCASPMQR